MSFEDYETELLESLTVPVNGLPSEFDSDEGLIPMGENTWAAFTFLLSLSLI